MSHLSAAFVALLAACQPEGAGEDPVTAARLRVARIQAARAARDCGSDPAWAGPRRIAVYALDPGDPGPAALAAALGEAPRAWDGRRPRTERGEVAVLWIEADTPLEPLAEALAPPEPGAPGELVAVLAPAGRAWVEEGTARLPWAGLGVLDAQAELALWKDVSEGAVDPALAGLAVARRLSEHYGVATVTPDGPLPPGLDERLRQADPGDAASPDPRTRAGHAYATGDPALAADPQVAVRLALAETTGDARVLDGLARDPEPLVRARAADRVEDVAILAALARDPSSVVRVVAADRVAALVRTRGPGPELRGILECAARGADAYQRWKAAWGLGFAPGSAPLLISLLQDPDIDVQREAARSLGRLRDPAGIEPMVALLASPNHFVRRWTAEALGAFDEPRARAALEALLSDPTAQVARTAARALGRPVPAGSPGAAPPVSEAEIAALAGSPDDVARKDVAKHLAGRPEALPWLLRLAADRDSDVRKSAVEALGWTAEARGELPRFLADPDPDVQVTALEALRRAATGDPRVLVPFLEHPDAELRLRAAEALAALGPVPALERCLADPDERTRAAAASAFPARIPLDDPSVLVRRAAAARDPDRARWQADPDLLVRAAVPASPDAGAASWAAGVVAREDDLLHLRFSWNDPAEQPASFRCLRPPVVRAYGHPDRG